MEPEGLKQKDTLLTCLHYLWISEDIRILQSFRQTKYLTGREKKVEFIITYTVDTV